MEISTEKEGEILVAKPEGRIDSTTARAFQEALETAIKDGNDGLILDLEEVSYISSAGLRVILIIAKTLQKDNRKLAVCALVESIVEVFKISGFDKIIPIYSTKAEAQAAIGN